MQILFCYSLLLTVFDEVDRLQGVLTFFQLCISVIASPLSTVSHYSGVNLPREKENSVRLRTQLCWKPSSSLPCSHYTRLSGSTLRAELYKERWCSHLCLYNSVICLDNCMFVWTNTFFTVFHVFYLACTATYSHKHSHVHYTRRALSNYINFVSVRDILLRTVAKYTCFEKPLQWLMVSKRLIVIIVSLLVALILLSWQLHPFFTETCGWKFLSVVWAMTSHNKCIPMFHKKLSKWKSPDIFSRHQPFGLMPKKFMYISALWYNWCIACPGCLFALVGLGKMASQGIVSPGS